MQKQALPQWIFTAFLTGTLIGAFVMIWSLAGFQTYHLPILGISIYGIYKFSIKS